MSVEVVRLGDDRIYLSGDVVEHIGGDLTYATLHRWIRNGAVTPTRPPTGSGSNAGWSHDDLRAVEAIARVRADLATLGLPCPWHLVGQLWNQLTHGDLAELTTDTVEISVRRGLEG
jgi:hypothetical protein